MIPAAERPVGLDEPAVRGPVRRLQVTTLGTGAVSALAAAGVLALQSDPGYVRAVLQARSWGAVEVTDTDDGGARFTVRLPLPRQAAVGVGA